MTSRSGGLTSQNPLVLRCSCVAVRLEMFVRVRGHVVALARESFKGVLLGPEAGSERPHHHALESPLSTAIRIPGDPRLAGRGPGPVARSHGRHR